MTTEISSDTQGEREARRRMIGAVAAVAATGTALLLYPKEARADISDEIKKGVDGVGGDLGKVTKFLGIGDGGDSGGLDLEGVLKKFFSSTIFKVIEDKSKEFADGFKFALPSGMSKGPNDALKAFTQLGSLLRLLGRADEVTDRLRVIQSSVSGVGPQDVLFNGLFTGALDDIEKAFKCDTDIDSLVVSRLQTMADPTQIFNKLLDFFKDKNNFLKWTDLPSGLGPGTLYNWLNGEGAFAYKTPAELHSLDRQFRAQCIARLDGYFRKRTANTQNHQGMPAFDERTSTGILSDLITLCVETVITFVLQPECYPVHEDDFVNFEDVGHGFAGFAARPIHAGVLGLIGTVLRGIWTISVRNENLIEGIGTIIGTAFRSLLEGIIRNVTWALEIQSVYPDHLPPADTYVFDPWPSSETIGATSRRLQYCAFIRGNHSPLPVLRNQLAGLEIVKKLVQDCAAYADACYLHFRLDPRFPAIEGDTVTIDHVILTSIGDKSTLSIQATTTETTEPIPVLRAYYGCEMLVLSPPDATHETYWAEIDVSRLYRTFDLDVLSNRGGKSHRDASAIEQP